MDYLNCVLSYLSNIVPVVMVRIDIWDKVENLNPEELQLGLPRSLEDLYEFGD